MASVSAGSSSNGNGFSEVVVVMIVVLIIGAVAVVAHYVDPRFLKLDFWQLLFANLVGVLGGGYLALWRNRAVSDRRQRERAQQALGALREAVEHNQEQVEKLLRSLDEDPRSAVFSTADPDAFDPILNRLVETVDEFRLIRDASNLRHRLSEFCRMAEAQLDLYLLPENHPRRRVGAKGDTAEARIRAVRDNVLEKIENFGPRISSQADDLLGEIEKVQTEVRNG